MSDGEKLDLIEKYNTGANRFLFYPWGVFVTAYARRNLFTGIYECCKTNDYLYSDTDSIKITNAENHMEYFEKYNTWITNKLEYAVKQHGLNTELLQPKTVDGVKKPLGIWDFDGEYTKFKTLGAKRYIMTYSDSPKNGEKKRGKNFMTVAGLGKKSGIKYLEIFGNKMYDEFNNEMEVPPEYSGRTTYTYIDILRSGKVTDYLGNTADYYEMSGTHLENSEYTLTLAPKYVEFLIGLVERGLK